MILVDALCNNFLSFLLNFIKFKKIVLNLKKSVGIKLIYSNALKIFQNVKKLSQKLQHITILFNAIFALFAICRLCIRSIAISFRHSSLAKRIRALSNRSGCRKSCAYGIRREGSRGCVSGDRIDKDDPGPRARCILRCTSWRFLLLRAATARPLKTEIRGSQHTNIPRVTCHDAMHS